MSIPLHAAPTIQTVRLLLRPWRDADREPFAAMGQDPAVMRYMPGLLSRREADEYVDLFVQQWEEHGHGKWAVELTEPGSETGFIGYVGLTQKTFEAPLTPAVEIAWRIASAHHNRGYATEGARAVLRHGFEVLGMNEIVSMTPPVNRASRRVMEKLGMHRDPGEDFEHPGLEAGHPLRRHLLCRLQREEWAAGIPG